MRFWSYPLNPVKSRNFWTSMIIKRQILFCKLFQENFALLFQTIGRLTSEPDLTPMICISKLCCEEFMGLHAPQIKNEKIDKLIKKS